MTGFSVHPYHVTAYVMPLAVDKENWKLKKLIRDFFFKFKIMNNRLIYLFAPKQARDRPIVPWNSM